MPSDLYTRAVLAVMALCLVVLVARSFAPVAAAGAVRGDSEAEARYRLMAVGPARSVFRVDVQSGRVWRLPFRAGSSWELIEEAAEGDIEVNPEAEEETGSGTADFPGGEGAEAP